MSFHDIMTDKRHKCSANVQLTCLHQLTTLMGHKALEHMQQFSCLYTEDKDVPQISKGI